MWRSFYLNNRLLIENYIFCEINIYFGAYYLWNHSFERYIVIYTCIFWEHRKYIWKLEKKLNVGPLSQSSVPAPLHTLHETMTGGPAQVVFFSFLDSVCFRVHAFSRQSAALDCSLSVLASSSVAPLPRPLTFRSAHRHESTPHRPAQFDRAEAAPCMPDTRVHAATVS